jgi:DNA-binding response OmpR family regulator
MKPAHIILIEDNPADVLLVRLALEENGIVHAMTEFKNGLDAVRTLCVPAAERPFEPDAILLDLNTPRTDGFDVLSQLRRCFEGVPITVLTSSRARSDKQRASSFGACYLEKPCELQDFIVAVGGAVREMLRQPSSH